MSWIVYHGSYDFGYLLKLLSGEKLPNEASDFLVHLNYYFPKIFDIKQITCEIDYLSGGLNSMANKLDVKRMGTKH